MEPLRTGSDACLVGQCLEFCVCQGTELIIASDVTTPLLWETLGSMTVWVLDQHDDGQCLGLGPDFVSLLRQSTSLLILETPPLLVTTPPAWRWMPSRASVFAA